MSAAVTVVPCDFRPDRYFRVVDARGEVLMSGFTGRGAAVHWAKTRGLEVKS